MIRLCEAGLLIIEAGIYVGVLQVGVQDNYYVCEVRKDRIILKSVVDYILDITYHTCDICKAKYRDIQI